LSAMYSATAGRRCRLTGARVNRKLDGIVNRVQPGRPMPAPGRLLDRGPARGGTP
jgi:hypothetical protein